MLYKYKIHNCDKRKLGVDYSSSVKQLMNLIGLKYQQKWLEMGGVLRYSLSQVVTAWVYAILLSLFSLNRLQYEQELLETIASDHESEYKTGRLPFYQIQCLATLDLGQHEWA